MVSAAEGRVPSVHQAKRHRKRLASQDFFQGMSPENQVSSVMSHLPKVPSASLDVTSWHPSSEHLGLWGEILIHSGVSHNATKFVK